MGEGFSISCVHNYLENNNDDIVLPSNNVKSFVTSESVLIEEEDIENFKSTREPESPKKVYILNNLSKISIFLYVIRKFDFIHLKLNLN